jgi:hypothetical protein
MIEDMPRVHGMSSKHFKLIEKGFNGTLSRHGTTIVIVLQFSNVSIAKGAEKYICGDA